MCEMECRRRHRSVRGEGSALSFAALRTVADLNWLKLLLDTELDSAAETTAGIQGLLPNVRSNARVHRRRVSEANEGTPSPQGEGRPSGTRCWASDLSFALLLG